MASDDINLVEFAGLAAAASRLLAQLSALPVFKTSGLGFTEWVALTLTAERGSVSTKALAKLLGINGKRTGDLAAALSTSGMATLARVNDGKQVMLKVSDKGKAKLEDVNEALLPLLASTLKGRERSVVGAGKAIRLMTRVGVAQAAR